MTTPPVDRASIDAAVARLRAGEVVAFPTETVYGLAADALNQAAIARLISLKGRPDGKPFSVLVADIDAARALVEDWPDRADILASRYWPGPLTIVLPKSHAVPDAVTAGSSNIGLRCPDHPVALELIRAFGNPIAAPSANKSGSPEPRTACDVRAAFPDLFILDAGPCALGTPSTVLLIDDDRGDRILRAGALSPQQLGL
ncbi:MAG: threonylcarbamoyl-AMP synthase [Phycisphaerales bacterium]|nr:threonylcarbamoyl-AMP synthase [Phycisphaerales bacterium]